MRHKKLAALVLGMIAVLLAAACSSDPTATPAPTQSSGPAPTPTLTRETLKMGWVTFVTTEWGYMVAEDQGFYDRAGLDVEFVALGNFADLNTALISGQVDVIAGAYTSPIFAQASGVPMKLIMAGHNTRWGYNNWYAALPNRDDLNTIADMEGQTVDIFLDGSFAWTTATWYMEQNGVDLNKVELIGLPFPESYPSLLQGRSDVAIFIEPFFSLGNKASIEEFGAPLKVIWDFEEAMGMDDIVLASPGIAMENTIANKPEALRRYVQATIEAQRWGFKTENWPTVRRLIGEWTVLSADIAADMMMPPASLDGRFPVDIAGNGEDQLTRTQRMLIERGVLDIPEPMPVDQIFYMGFLP